MKAQTYDKDWWRPATPETAASPVAPVAEEPGSRLPFLALLMFTGVLLLAPQEVYPVLAPLRLALLTAAFALLCHLYDRMVNNRPFFDMTRALSLFGLLVAWGVATLPLSYWPNGSLQFLADQVFRTLIVFLLLANVLDTLPRLRGMAWGMVLMAVPLAYTAVENFAVGGEGGRIMGYDAPLTANPNDMALMMNLILPLAIGLFLANEGKGGKRVVLGGIICLLATAVIVTFSRAGFIGLATIFLCYAWRLRNRPERIWAPIVLVLVFGAVPFLPDSYFDRIGTITNVEADETGSAQERLRDMGAATLYVLQNPIVGAGIGQNELAMNEVRGDTWLEIHNVYLMFAVELGLPGLVLFLMLFATCLRYTRETMRRSMHWEGMETLYYLSEGLRISLIAFALEAMFYPVAWHFYFYFIAGLAVAAWSLGVNEEQRRSMEAREHESP